MAKPNKVLVYRHSAVTRLTHWVNVVAIGLLLLSGLQIFNAHPALYWGQKSTFATPWVWIDAQEKPNGDFKGFTKIGRATFDTTGVLGYSGKPGLEEKRAFPSWMTMPTYRDLASGRRWHFFFASLFVINGLVYLAAGLFGGHIAKDLLPTVKELAPKNLLHEVVTHAQLKFPKGEDARRYNVLQKLTYAGTALVLLPLMVLTGLSMSPGFNAVVPSLLDIFGGRQSARTIHFLSAGLIVLFIVVHLVMVLVSGVWNNIRSMVTGRYAIEVEGDAA